MEIADWRRRIDEIDAQLVELLNQRCGYAQQIGLLKRGRGLNIYEPSREKVVLENVSKANRGPLTDAALHRIFERVIDEMRAIQKHEMLTDAGADGAAAPSKRNE